MTAANKAAKPLTGSSRNRPSLSMSQAQIDPSSTSVGEISAAEQVLGGSFTTRGSGGPLFMDELQSQYESLGEKLARESTQYYDNSSRNSKSSRKVRWAETAAVASTLDAENAASRDDDADRFERSPIDVVSDLFQRKYTLPIFLVMTSTIFLMVHLAGGGDEKFKRYDPSTKSMSSIGARSGNRYKNLEGGTGFGETTFSLSPASADMLLTSISPTSEAIGHTTPKITTKSLTATADDGNDQDWVLVPTQSGVFDAAAGPNVGSPTTLLWEHSPGYPSSNQGTPTTILWNYPKGVPTPDPALLLVSPARNDGTPTTLQWNLGVGVPNPDPALLPNLGKPTTLTWSALGYRPNTPTPDPVYLTSTGGEPLTWSALGYDPNSPTPDPVYLTSMGGEPLVWGYPPSYPTPDPVHLVQGGGNTETAMWGYPPSYPTPDPAQLLYSVKGPTDPPTLRNVEVGIMISPPTKKPTIPGAPIDESVVLKMDNDVVHAPHAPRPPSAPTPANAPKPKPVVSGGASDTDVSLGLDESGQQQQGMYDSFGNLVEAAPLPPRPAPVGRPARPAVNVNNVEGAGFWDGPNGQTITGYYPEQPGQVPLVGGVVNTQSCGCCGCCSGCGGGGAASGGTTYNLVLPSGDHWKNLVALLTGDTKAIAAEPGFTMAPSLMKQPECPWKCFIDENIPTHGKSNQDDAIYEIFYSNPLNCCGTIVEIGAGDGVEGSASYFFDFGMNWTSILTEADPKKYSALVQNRKGKKARAVQGAFCKDGPYALYDDASSRFKPVGDDIISEAVSMDVADTAQHVPCIRLDRDVLAGVNHVNVMMVHVSGDPWPVLATMNWETIVDIWVLELDETKGLSHATLRAALKIHGYVQAKWDITLWCDAPNTCMQNEVWLREGFNPISKQILQAGLRGSSSIS